MAEQEADNLRERQEERANLTSLLEHPGYSWLVAMLNEQIGVRDKAYRRRPLDSINEILGEQYQKGEMAGLEIAATLINMRIEVLNEEIDIALKEMENGERTQRNTAEHDPLG